MSDGLRVPSSQPADAKLLVDGHVHFHECFTWKVFLDAAAANFARARRGLGLSPDSPGCLMFTESAGVHCYRALAEDSAVARSLGWHVQPGDDPCSIVLSRAGSESIVMVAGRQIVTAERLEVLALGCPDEFSDGRPIRDVVRAVVDRGALAVIPWGFGKWLGRRGRMLRTLIEHDEGAPFFLGDNGGRPSVLRRPALLDWAEGRGVLVLGGSDPMSMPGQVSRAGSFGFVLDAWRTTSTPATAIKAQIQALHDSPSAFGHLSTLPQVVRSQLGIRWQRRRIRAGRGQPAGA